MDDCGTKEGSTSDAAVECPALPPPPSCLNMDAQRICFFWMCILEHVGALMQWLSDFLCVSMQ